MSSPSDPLHPAQVPATLPDHQATSPTTSDQSALKERVLANVETLLSGPQIARIISGTLLVSVAALVFVSQVIDMWQRHVSKQHDADEYRTADATHDASRDAPAGASLAAAQTVQADHLQHHLLLNDGRPLHTTWDFLVSLATLSLGSNKDLPILQYYTSDGCIFVHRHNGSREFDQWVPDPIRGIHAPSGPAATSHPRFESVPIESKLLYTSATPPKLLRVQGGRCVNPHPGPFNWWWGPPSGCWVPMFRQFQDGCSHHQMFNSCGNYWDMNILWDRCLH